MGHDRLHRAVAQREDPADDLLFDLLHLAVLGPLLDDRADFRLGDLRFGLAQSEQAGHACRALGEQPDERRGRGREQPHRAGHDLGHAFGGVHADPFGNQLAEDEREVGDDDDDGELRREGGRGDRNTQPRQLRARLAGQRVARVDTREDADQRDADLDGREEPVRVPGEFERLPRRRAALPGLHFEVRTARRDEGDFRHGEQAVQQDQ